MFKYDEDDKREWVMEVVAAEHSRDAAMRDLRCAWATIDTLREDLWALHQKNEALVVEVREASWGWTR